MAEDKKVLPLGIRLAFNKVYDGKVDDEETENDFEVFSFIAVDSTARSTLQTPFGFGSGLGLGQPGAPGSAAGEREPKESDPAVTNPFRDLLFK
jgi:hypothetical protein